MCHENVCLMARKQKQRGVALLEVSGWCGSKPQKGCHFSAALPRMEGWALRRALRFLRWLCAARHAMRAQA